MDTIGTGQSVLVSEVVLFTKDTSGTPEIVLIIEVSLLERLRCIGSRDIIFIILIVFVLLFYHFLSLRGYAFIRFEEDDAVDNVIAERPHSIDGKVIDSNKAIPHEVHQVSPTDREQRVTVVYWCVCMQSALVYAGWVCVLVSSVINQRVTVVYWCVYMQSALCYSVHWVSVCVLVCSVIRLL